MGSLILEKGMGVPFTGLFKCLFCIVCINCSVLQQNDFTEVIPVNCSASYVCILRVFLAQLSDL